MFKLPPSDMVLHSSTPHYIVDTSLASSIFKYAPANYISRASAQYKYNIPEAFHLLSNSLKAIFKVLNASEDSSLPIPWSNRKFAIAA